MIVGENASNHDSTTDNHFLWVTHYSHGGSAARHNWYNVAGIQFSENRNPCLMSFRRIKFYKQQVMTMHEDGR